MPSQSPSNCSPGKLSPPFLLLSMTSWGMGYPFGQFGSAVLAVSALNFLPSPSLLPGRATFLYNLDKHHVKNSKTSCIYLYRSLKKSIMTSLYQSALSLDWGSKEFSRFCRRGSNNHQIDDHIPLNKCGLILSFCKNSMEISLSTTNRSSSSMC